MNLCLALRCHLFVLFCDIYHLADLLPTDSLTSLIPRLSNICHVLSFLQEFENSDSALSAKYRCEVFFSWLVVISQHYGLSSSFWMTDLPFVCPRQLLHVHCYSQQKLKQQSKITQETILSNFDNCFQFKKVSEFCVVLQFFLLSLKSGQ